MNLTLNPYVLVADVKGTYFFILSDDRQPVRLMPTKRQSQMLEEMDQGAWFSYEELCGAFDQSVVDALVQNGCLVPEKVDTTSIFSRTDAFFLTHHMPEARSRLSEKKVLILGCGGIGTHMAWHMAALGVAGVTIVDFDAVETSNFNRQILFDQKDVGKSKIEVLAAKLRAINPYIAVNTICAKISSEEELAAICLSDNYDLIVKALDSPAEFPVWMESVAKKNKLTYLAGITMRENVLIGPSYIPGISSYGWSDLMGSGENSANKLYGTAPSLGIMLYRISDELATEAFKILTGYGRPKYTDRILCENILTDERQYIRKADSVQNTARETNMAREQNTVREQSMTREQNTASGCALALCVVLMAVLAIAGTQTAWFVPLSFAAAMILPFILCHTDSDVMRCTFVNAAIAAAGLLIRLSAHMDAGTPAELIAVIVLLFGVHSAATLFTCMANYFIQRRVLSERSGRQTAGPMSP